MHIVFLNQYYPPDAAPTGVVLDGLVVRLLEDGHDVTVICGAGGYASAGGGAAADLTKTAPRLRVLRVGATRFGRGTFVGKLMDYATYYLGSAWRLMWLTPRPARVVALTTPPYLSLLARIVSKFRGADHAHWVMDLYPDVMQAHGMIDGTGLLYRILAGFARYGFGGNRCAAVLTLGPDMAERTACHLDRHSARVEWVPLWAAAGDHDAGVVGTTSRALRHQRGWADDDVVVMYSGNMGLGHRFDEILEAVRAWGSNNPTHGSPRLRFVFFGGGKRRCEVDAFVRDHPDCGVELHDYAPAELLDPHLQSADVHFVSLDPSWSGAMVPSKLQGVFAAGRPVVFVGSAQSSIGQWIEQSGGGWRVDANDVPALLEVFEELLDSAGRNTRGANAKTFANQHFNRTTNISRVAEIFARQRFSETTAVC